MMFSTIFLVCLAAGSVSGALQALPSTTFDVFVKHFRQTLVEKVALEVNKTVDDSDNLKKMVEACKPKIEVKVNECKTCAKSKCQASPSFTDILNIVNPYTYLKGPLDDIGGKVVNVVDLIGDQAGGFINSMKGLGANIKLPPEFKFIYAQVKAGIEKAINSLKSLGKDISGFVIDTGSIIGDSFKKLGDILGKKRRKREAIDPKVRKCMEQCASCTPILLPTEGEIITAVCGDEIVKKNTTIQNNLKKIQGVYDAAVATVNPIIKKVDVIVEQFQVKGMQITAFLNGKYATYTTVVPVSMLDLAVGPARGMAMEFWGKFSG